MIFARTSSPFNLSNFSKRFSRNAIWIFMSPLTSASAIVQDPSSCLVESLKSCPIQTAVIKSVKPMKWTFMNTS